MLPGTGCGSGCRVRGGRVGGGSRRSPSKISTGILTRGGPRPRRVLDDRRPGLGLGLVVDDRGRRRRPDRRGRDRRRHRPRARPGRARPGPGGAGRGRGRTTGGGGGGGGAGSASGSTTGAGCSSTTGSGRGSGSRARERRRRPCLDLADPKRQRVALGDHPRDLGRRPDREPGRAGGGDQLEGEQQPGRADEAPGGGGGAAHRRDAAPTRKRVKAASASRIAATASPIRVRCRMSPAISGRRPPSGSRPPSAAERDRRPAEPGGPAQPLQSRPGRAAPRSTGIASPARRAAGPRPANRARSRARHRRSPPSG